MRHTSCPSNEHLLDLANGRGSEADVHELYEHLTACASCEQAFDTLCDDSDTFLRELSKSPVSDCDEPEYRRLYQELISNPESLGTVPESNVAPDFSLPFRLSEYELLERIGRGANGSVYKARHCKLDRPVIVKVIRRLKLEDDERITRFDREMRVIGQLNHSNIVRATDAGEFGEYYYLAMEYEPGIDISTVLHTHGVLSESDACEVARQVAVALSHIHKHNLVHRDIKPSNLLLTATGQIKVLDLGLVAIRNDASEDSLLDTHPRGTPDYMSPEQWRDFDNVDIRADLYGLGCTLYKLLTRRTPFSKSLGARAKRDAHCNLPVDSLRERHPEISSSLEHLIHRLLAKSPADRFQTPDELIVELERFSADANLRRICQQIPALRTESTDEVAPATAPATSTIDNPISRRVLIGLASVAATGWAWNRFFGDSPSIDTSSWRPISPAMPNRLLPMMTANHLKVIHELAESGAEPPTAQEASDESRSKVESNWDERARHATIHVSESGIVLSNFGFPVTSKFGIQIGVNQKTWLGDTGVFFGFRSRRVASANMHSFQSIELVKIPETTPSFRILWSRYNVRQQLRAKATIETSRGFLHATQLPLADIEISEPDHRVQRLCVFVGETGMPQVSLNDNQLINWKLSFAGRKYVGMNPERLNSHMQGRIGTIARRGTTLFSNPQLKYLT